MSIYNDDDALARIDALLYRYTTATNKIISINQERQNIAKDIMGIFDKSPHSIEAKIEGVIIKYNFKRSCTAKRKNFIGCNEICLLEIEDTTELYETTPAYYNVNGSFFWLDWLRRVAPITVEIEMRKFAEEQERSADAYGALRDIYS
jgi:hypothetical protein